MARLKVTPSSVVRAGIFMCFGALLFNLFHRGVVEESTDHIQCKECKDHKAWDYSWDGGPVHFKGQHDEVRWRTMYFIRHGNYHSKGDKYGHLTDKGIKQAEYVAERLASLGLKVTRFESSTSPRAVETANIIKRQLLVGNPNITLKPSPDLLEGWPVMPQPTVIYPRRTEWDITEEKLRMPQAFKRIFKRPRKGKYRDTNEIYVCHGNIISYFVLRALQVPVERFLRLTIQQGSITEIMFNSKGLFKVKSVGDTGHIPHQLLE